MKTQNLNYRSIGLAVLVFTIAVVINGCKKENTVANQVVMQNIAFNPSSLTVAKNTTVTWVNKDNMTHNVTSDSGLFVSGNVVPGSDYSFQFTVTGTYPYRCTIHQGMNGVIVVQ